MSIIDIVVVSLTAIVSTIGVAVTIWSIIDTRRIVAKNASLKKE